MALNDILATGIRPEWFTQEALRDARWLMPFTKRLAIAMDACSARLRNEVAAGEPMEEVADDILDEMDKRRRNPGFDGADELIEWADKVLNAVYGDEGWKTYAEFGDKLPVLLLRPLDRYAFQIDVVPAHKHYAHSFGYIDRLLVGGTNELTLQSVAGTGRSNVLRVRGSVRAPDIGGIVRRTERVLDELCGALRALGLAEFVPLPPKNPNTFVVVDENGQEHPDEFFELGQISLPEVKVEEWKVPLALEASYVRRLSGFVLTIPEDLDELRRAQLTRGDFAGALGSRHRVFERVLRGTSPRCAELRAACRRMVEAELSTDFGLTVTLAFSAVEGLLLDPNGKEDVLGRLTEAVAHSIAVSAAERSQLRKRVKDLYGKRSKFVHTGSTRQAAMDRQESISLGYRVLRRELELLQHEASEDLKKEI